MHRRHNTNSYKIKQVNRIYLAGEEKSDSVKIDPDLQFT